MQQGGVWILAPEIATNHLRSKTIGLATGIYYGCSLTITAWLPYALNPTVGNLGAKVKTAI